jgi:hypothetical protein
MSSERASALIDKLSKPISSVSSRAASTTSWSVSEGGLPRVRGDVVVVSGSGIRKVYGRLLGHPPDQDPSRAEPPQRWILSNRSCRAMRRPNSPNERMGASYSNRLIWYRIACTGKKSHSPRRHPDGNPHSPTDPSAKELMVRRTPPTRCGRRPEERCLNPGRPPASRPIGCGTWSTHATSVPAWRSAGRSLRYMP